MEVDFQKPSKTGMSSHQRTVGVSENWLTPRWMLEALGPFDLDPCASKNPPWSTAERVYTVEDDGLNRPWSGLVWMNPPYNKAIELWMRRLAEHGNGLALVFARTETKWFHRQVWRRADAVLFLDRRIAFHEPDGEQAKGTAGAPSCLVAYGALAGVKLVGAGISGYLVTGGYRVAAKDALSLAPRRRSLPPLPVGENFLFEGLRG